MPDRRALDACSDSYRPLIATALYTGMRISQLLGLIWDDVELDRGEIHVRAQLSCVHRNDPEMRDRLTRSEFAQMLEPSEGDLASVVDLRRR